MIVPPIVFSIIVWGTLLIVAIVFSYVLITVLSEAGISRNR